MHIRQFLDLADQLFIRQIDLTKFLLLAECNSWYTTHYNPVISSQHMSDSAYIDEILTAEQTAIEAIENAQRER